MYLRIAYISACAMELCAAIFIAYYIILWLGLVWFFVADLAIVIIYPRRTTQKFKVSNIPFLVLNYVLFYMYF